MSNDNLPLLPYTRRIIGAKVVGRIEVGKVYGYTADETNAYGKLCYEAGKLAAASGAGVPDHREFTEGVVYACARMIECYDQPTLAGYILGESGVDVALGCPDDLEFIRTIERFKDVQHAAAPTHDRDGGAVIHPNIERYEYVRCLHPADFEKLVSANIAGVGKFDDLVDKAIAAKLAR